MDPRQEKMNFEKEEGIKNSYENADMGWKLATIKNLESFCEKNQFFSVNDFREYNQEISSSVSTYNGRAMGGIMRVGVKNGWMKATPDKTIGFSAHGQLVQIWQSLIYNREIIKI